MKLSEIIDCIESIAPPHAAAAWDNSGMQVACHTEHVTHVAVCLDPTPQALTTALECGAGFVVSHHPLLLHARLPAITDAYHAVLSLLFRHDMGLYAAHTSLDAHPLRPAAPAAWLADALGLMGRTLLETTHRTTEQTYGFGLVGDLPEPLAPASLWRCLDACLPLAQARQCGAVPAYVRRVALCMGSGASLIKTAHSQRADVYITGDMKYHDALDAPLWLIDAGHHALEEEMTRCFAQTLAAALPIEVTHIPSQTPFRMCAVRV